MLNINKYNRVTQLKNNNSSDYIKQLMEGFYIMDILYDDFKLGTVQCNHNLFIELLSWADSISDKKVSTSINSLYKIISSPDERSIYIDNKMYTKTFNIILSAILNATQNL